MVAATLVSLLALASTGVSQRIKANADIPPYPDYTGPGYLYSNFTQLFQPKNAYDFNVIGTPLQKVHEFYGDFPTQLAVDKFGRFFNNFPSDNPTGHNATYSMGIATSFKTEMAYPNETYQHCKPGQDLTTCLINVQSFYIDNTGVNMYVLDTGMPAVPNSKALLRGVKVVAFDLNTDTIKRTYPLPAEIVNMGVNVNDIRVNSTRNFGFISDTNGSIITLDFTTGLYKRHLYNYSVVVSEPQLVGGINGQPYIYKWNGTQRDYYKSGCNGIGVALDYLYFSAQASRRVHRVPQSIITDPNITDEELIKHVEELGQIGAFTSGFDTDDKGRVYMGTPEQNSVTYFNTSYSDLTPENLINNQHVGMTGIVKANEIQFAALTRSAYIAWPDSIYINAGFLYITTNELPLSPQFQKGNVDNRRKPYIAYRVYTGTNNPV